MCAIVGKLRKNRPIERPLLEAMRDTMTHRGPDDAGLWFNAEGTVGLGHRRLSIIDLSSAGHQPMTNEDESIWLVFNGEIYNFQALRQELLQAGHVFRSNTDTEVIIHAYEEWGVDSIKRLRGMFAYALWDIKRQRLVLARDRLGIKPLYYALRDGNLSFASELKAIRIDPDVRCELDESAIYDFFTYRYIPTPKTIYRDVSKLPPAHFAVMEDNKLTLTCYWEPVFNNRSDISEADAVELLQHKLKEATELHMIADVPVGVMLSGGLDSSTLLALAADTTAQPLHTFSIGFDVARHSETLFARIVAERYGSQHHELTVTKAMADSLEHKIVQLYDEPYADSSAIPTFLVSELAVKNVKVALSGEGGDEIFGGYGWYSLWWRMRAVDRIPIALRRLAALPMSVAPLGFKGKWTLQAAALDPISRYGKFISAFSRQDKRHLLGPEFYKRFEGYDDYWFFRKYWREDLDPYSRMQYLDLKTYLNDDILTKVDRASMAVSLEARVPLLDHELIEAVLSLPVEIRNKDGKQKHLFRKAIKDYLPAEILNRGKQGFSIPLYEWLKDPHVKELEPLFDNNFISRKLIQSGKMTGSDLWPFIVMGKWLQRYA
jgi:asparagine synthase (glutamine-hydrolysing)